ncbi:hypothetical protein [Psychroserpens damuponensis]|uniref:hypothetical protein n=1 Tax=Psychroserpens damuponensis TaxID=943936 RepID=UPI000B0FA9CD|nr:hypothetical protein [Psychroserpens damuponensis]
MISLAFAGYGVYNYTYKAHKTIDELELKYSGTSEVFLKKIKTNAKHWQNVVVQLNGTITAKDNKGITLNHSTYCQLDDVALLPSLEIAQKVTIKGRMIGYDDLLEEVKIDQTIIKN